MPTADELIVKIGADFAELKRELKKAGGATEEFADKGKASTDKFSAGLKGVNLASIAATVSVGALAAGVVAFTKSQLDAAKETRNWARQLNIAQHEFEALNAVGRRFGASTDDMGDSIKDLNERIADAARGNKTYAEALGIIGLKAEDLIKMPLEEQFIKVAGAIGQLNNAGDQNFVTAELMADAGFRLLPVFRKGEEGIRAMKEEVVKTNEALDATELAKMADLQKATDELAASWAATANTITQALLPAIKTMTTILKDASEYWGEIFGSAESSEKKKSIEEIRKELKKVDDEIARIEGLTGGSRSVIAQKGRLPALKAQAVALQNQVSQAAIAEEKKADLWTPATSAGAGAGRNASQGMGVFGGETATPYGGQENDPLVAGMIAYQEHQEAITESLRLSEELRANIALQAASEEIRLAQETKDKTLAIEREKAEGRKAIAKGMFGELSSLMNSRSRKMFEIGKAAAIANTVMNTYEAAQTNFAYGSKIGGPPLGAAFAAASVVAGLARVQSIASTTLGGGAGGGGGDPGGVGGVGGAQETVQVTNFDVTLQGNGMYTGDQVRSLIGTINEATGDNVKLNAILAK